MKASQTMVSMSVNAASQSCFYNRWWIGQWPMCCRVAVGRQVVLQAMKPDCVETQQLQLICSCHAACHQFLHAELQTATVAAATLALNANPHRYKLAQHAQGGALQHSSMGLQRKSNKKDIKIKVCQAATSAGYAGEAM